MRRIWKTSHGSYAQHLDCEGAIYIRVDAYNHVEKQLTALSFRKFLWSLIDLWLNLTEANINSTFYMVTSTCVKFRRYRHIYLQKEKACVVTDVQNYYQNIFSFRLTALQRWQSSIHYTINNSLGSQYGETKTWCFRCLTWPGQ